jgi:hypothetical protein
VTELKSWLQSNSTLVYFLIAQFLAISTAGLTFTAYMTQLESRLATLENRGSSHLADINNRLTVTEKETEANQKRIERIVDIMTKKLNINP